MPSGAGASSGVGAAGRPGGQSTGWGGGGLHIAPSGQAIDACSSHVPSGRLQTRLPSSYAYVQWLPSSTHLLTLGSGSWAGRWGEPQPGASRAVMTNGAAKVERRFIMTIERYTARRPFTWGDRATFAARPTMGLQWEPLPTPKRGHEREFVDLFHKLVASTGAKREQVVGWFNNVAVPPFETIGAPRVGYDLDADVWLFERLEQADRLGELEQVKIEMRGYHVLELMPPCDGFPVYSNHTVQDDLDRYSFHAELLADLRNELGAELCELAYTMMLPEAHRDFAARLFAVANQFAADHALRGNVATVREPVFAKGSQERRGHILYAAAKWCTYWSTRARARRHVLIADRGPHSVPEPITS